LLEWNTDSATDFYFTNCYKVIAQDSEDTIVKENCSLKNKVSQLILTEERKFLRLKSEFVGNDVSKELNHILKEAEIKSLYDILTSIYQ
jgi:hypothetical protein